MTKLTKDRSFTDYKIKTFHIKYDDSLSYVVTQLLKSFKTKYLYCVIDEIIYVLKSNPKEQKRLLLTICSIAIFLQNNFCISFFDMWIQEMFIQESSRHNKFLNQSISNLNTQSYLTISFGFELKSPPKKKEIPW